MLFAKKEFQEIKSAISEEELPPEQEQTIESMPALAPMSLPDAPLFVKVEKYKDMLMHLTKMKAHVSAAKQAFDILAELEILRNDALQLTRASVGRVEKSAIEMDAELLRPRGFEEEPDMESKHLEQTLKDLQSQLHELRTQLESLKA